MIDMKRICILLVALVFVLSSCKTSTYTVSLPIPNKIPNLVPVVNFNDMSLVYGCELVPVANDDDVEAAVNNSTLRVDEFTRLFTFVPKRVSYAKGSYASKVLKTGTYYPIKEKTYKSYANPSQRLAEIPLYLHMYNMEICKNVCNMTQEQYGYIELSILRHEVNVKFPCAIIEVRIYDRNNKLVGIYNGTGVITRKDKKTAKYGKRFLANMSAMGKQLYIDSFAKALNEIKVQISQDSQRLTAELNKAGTISK